MVRQARIKAVDGGVYYHIKNRISGPLTGYYPFSNEMREKAFGLLQELSEYYYIEPISFAMMGNHFHLVIYIPSSSELPGDEVILERFKNFYKGKLPPRKLNSIQDTEALNVTCEEMVSLSEYMRVFSQRFTSSYNRLEGCVGRIWSSRYISVILERESALWDCVKYIEMNPLRAKIVTDPNDYQFSSWGRYNHKAKHPFATSFEKHMSGLRGSANGQEGASVYDIFEADLKRTISEEKNPPPKPPVKKVATVKGKRGRKPKPKPVVPFKYLKRSAQWTEGHVIGSKAYIDLISLNAYKRRPVLLYRLPELGEDTVDSGAGVYYFRTPDPRRAIRLASTESVTPVIEVASTTLGGETESCASGDGHSGEGHEVSVEMDSNMPQ